MNHPKSMFQLSGVHYKPTSKGHLAQEPRPVEKPPSKPVKPVSRKHGKYLNSLSTGLRVLGFLGLGFRGLGPSLGV